MVFVQGGTFRMEGGFFDRAHQVTLSSYYIAKYEVTQGQWKAIMGNNPSKLAKGDNYPVENVPWNDMQTFITRLNTATGKHYRLPTEAEWEFAARGGNQSKGYKYSGSNNVDDVAWYKENSGKTTHPIGTKAPNELGIYDMSGNVYEWTGDRYEDFESNDQTNPHPPFKGGFWGDPVVIRGGSCKNNEKDLRVSHRNQGNQTIEILGFRLACDAE